MGFLHESQEIHKRDSKTRVASPGQDDGYVCGNIKAQNSSNDSAYNHALDNTSRSIFLALEQYIASAFEDAENLNSSFLAHHPSPPTRSGSEGLINANATRIDHSLTKAGTPGLLYPNLDAKTLLAGDIAENGSWWIGGEECSPEWLRPSSDRTHRPGTPKSFRKYPNINWNELQDWYDFLVNLSTHFDEMVLQKFTDPLQTGDCLTWPRLSPYLIRRHEGAISACAHVEKTLLKATERLLRRPTRPLRSIEDCRFLFIALANPLLKKIRNDTVKHSSPPNLHSKSTRKVVSPISPESPVIRSKMLRQGRVLHHTGIVKRILGLLANLPDESHRYLVQWFIRMPASIYCQITDLIGLFLTHRLNRHAVSERSSRTNDASVLVPELSQSVVESSSQLHAALGFTGTGNPLQNSESLLSYSDDWQIKAAAKVSSLLFAANIEHPARPSLPPRPSFDSMALHKTPLLESPHGQRARQLIPIDRFYNSRLDFADLIADYEVWEKQNGSFAFCQFPMLLSIWAKIRLMEFDARRQMEIKARQAFFESILGRKAINQYLVFKVRRECLVEDSLRNVSEVAGSGKDEIKKGLRIEFLGEDGFDAGGLRKEWFLMLTRDIFNPDHGLFIYDDESRYCYFNPHTFETTDQYFLVGVLLGLAIYNSTILDIALPPFAFRKLLASSPAPNLQVTALSRTFYLPTLDDLAEFRPSLAKGLRKLLEYDGNVLETFCMDFIIEVDQYGHTKQIPLCADGENIQVTNSNRQRFVDLYVRYALDTAVARQFEPFKRGFFFTCGGNAITLFRPEEVDLLIRGSTQDLDIATLRAVAIYDNWGANATNVPVVKWFWSLFEEAEPKCQRRLLSFITSSDRVPAVGATSLVIKLSCLGQDCDRFPIARTCFDMLGLYRYATRARLEEKLWRAVAESEGFALK